MGEEMVEGKHRQEGWAQKQKRKTKVSVLIIRTPHTYPCHKSMRTNPLGQWRLLCQYRHPQTGKQEIFTLIHRPMTRQTSHGTHAREVMP